MSEFTPSNPDNQEKKLTSESTGDLGKIYPLENPNKFIRARANEFIQSFLAGKGESALESYRGRPEVLLPVAWIEELVIIAAKSEIQLEISNSQRIIPGDEAICPLCNKACDALAGNPAKWPIAIAKDGQCVWHHMGCVSAKLYHPSANQEKINRSSTGDARVKSSSQNITPGPWFYRPHEFDDWGVVKDQNGFTLCQARDPRFIGYDIESQHRKAGTDPWEANARAIAALPDLIEATEKAIEHLERDAEWLLQENRRVSAEQNLQQAHALRSALKKAKGAE